ncbi:MAG TPA: DUF2806 domain-containing protein [Kofleriaceae bacterium]|jgi:hypothetical protein|nr:DUF2806 domain-containing protein [Kofleriaceae bacterium]
MAELKVSLLGMDKLIEVVAQGIGALAKPWMIRRVAKAQADRLKILANAEIEIVGQLQLPATTDTSGSQPSPPPLMLEARQQSSSLLTDAAEVFEKRMEQRIMLREARRQQNLESIALGAAHEIASIDEVSSDPIDDDWVARFFMNAQDVSTPELQRLWSTLLARETARPRTISMRTLETLKNLSPEEARLFEVSLTCLCEDDNELFFVSARHSSPWENQSLLMECGLFGPPTAFGVPDERLFKVSHNGMRLVFRPRPTHMKISRVINIMPLTGVGKTIADVCQRSLTPNREFLSGLLEHHTERFDIEVENPGVNLPLAVFLR